MLQISSDLYSAIRTHAEEAYPHECCGILLGLRHADRWRVTASIRTANAEQNSPRNRYRIDPRELARIIREAFRQGLEIAGFYHSHPDHPAQWSSTDLAEAHWIDCAYLITSVLRGDAGETNAFLLTGSGEDDKAFRPIPIETTEDTSASLLRPAIGS